ncbi:MULTISPECIES: DUF5131 family protein [unclassified Variovorax]|uniref:DUF5131 family protein n=1 Tax=unclassified Variovorax TaxID=663243 RepID=UPI003F45A46C
MSEHSTIEWTDATWNPVTGCSVTSPGCKNCYAMKLAGSRLQHHPSRAGLTQQSAAGPVWTGEVRFNEQWLEQPLQWSRGRMIFVCAHGDLFHESVPDLWIDQVFAVMALAPQHTFQVLTKRAARMREYFEHPMRETLIGVQVSRLHLKRAGEPVSTWSGLPLLNAWLGVSAEDQARADTRIPHLLATPAAVRFVSAEPLLGPLDLTRLPAPNCSDSCCDMPYLNGLTGARVCDLSGQEIEVKARIDWVIVGGESGADARPMHPAWARSLRDQCKGAGVPFHFKQWGAWAPGMTSQPDVPGKFALHWPDANGFVYCDVSPRMFNRFGIDTSMTFVGKKAAGRSLDGLTWDQMPAGGSHAAV